MLWRLDQETGPDLSDLLTGQFGFPVGVWCSALVDHVLRIVFCGTQEQVIRVAAVSNITGVAHHKAISNWTKECLVGNSMWTCRLSLDRADSVAATISG